MLPTVICIAISQAQAENIVERLQSANVPMTDVSVMLLPAEGASTPSIKGLESASKEQVKEDVATGASAGYLAGVAVGVASLTIPWAQPLLLLVAPIALIGGTATGALAGAATGMSSLKEYGIPESRSEYFQQKLQAGGFLVAVRTEDEAELERAQAIFEQAGAQDIALHRLTKKLT